MVEKRPGEVSVIQYLRPNGVKREMLANVGEEYVKKSKDMILEAEVVPGNMVALWVRFKDEPEEDQLMDLVYNGPGERTPESALRDLIEEKYKERHECE